MQTTKGYRHMAGVVSLDEAAANLERRLLGMESLGTNDAEAAIERQIS